MKIQRFEGDNTREALAKVQQALGEDAVILQTRSIRTPGALRRPRVEVLAAVEGASGGMLPRQIPPPEQPEPLSEIGGLTPSEPRTAVTFRAPAPEEHSVAEDWQEELSQLRHEMAQLRTQLSQAPLSPQPKFDLEQFDTPLLKDTEAPQGTEAQGTEAPPPQDTSETLVQRLRNELHTSSIQLKTGRPTVICLVGSTGVGKTTTLAKLAAAASRQERKRIAVITIDTYRIGALEQLEAYARLLEVPMTRVYAPEDIRGALERYSSYDLIFVDTIGRSAFNTQQIAEQAEFLEALGTDEVHLCLDSGASPATLRRSLEGFSPLRPTHVILTKIDETASLEVALETVLESGLPLSYVTTGQRVPEDLTLASPDEMVACLLQDRQKESC